MKIPQSGYLMLALLCGELVWAFAGLLLVGIRSVVAAMLWDN
jgi:hypothetical protein